MHVSALYRYPLKSCAARAEDALDIEPRGPAGDRRWLAVDGDGRFLTAREHPQLVRVQATLTPSGLHLQHSVAGALHVVTPGAGAPRRSVQVWRSTVDAAVVDAPEVTAWLRAVLGFDAALVHMDATTTRAVNPAHAQPGDEVSFADAYPLLVIGQASLDGLNARLPAPVPMTRFRPNIVIAGSEAHAEDGWRRVRIGTVVFEATTRCTRCVFTTIDPATAVRDARGEPLRTLATYRRGDGGVVFGMNLISRGTGCIAVGDAVVPLD